MDQLKEDYFVRSSNRVLLISVTILGLVSILAGIISSRMLTRPILELVVASGNIANGNLSCRVNNSGNDEIGCLSKSFNSMAQNLEAQEKLRRMLLSNAAHELRTPLAIISGEIEGMLDGVLPINQSALLSLHDETVRLTAILYGVDELSRAEACVLNLNKEIFALKPYLTNIVNRFERIFADKDAVLLLDCSENLYINADPDRLSQIIINLISNSNKAISFGGRVTIIAYSDINDVCIEISDNGCGIQENDLPYIFERFYKGKNGGLGIGLAIVQELVFAHGGNISVKSSTNDNTSFHIKIPIA